MTEAFKTLIINIANLFKLKSIITMALTATLIALLSGRFNPSQEFTALFCTTYGSVMTYYFTRKDDKPAGETMDFIAPEEEGEGVPND